MFGHDSSQPTSSDDQSTFSATAPDATSAPVDTPATGGAQTDLPDVGAATSTPAVTPTVTPSTPVAGSDELLDIKQQALQELSPLVGHLEQTPEEKFRTTMMMIQASDDQSLIRAAYDAAKQISDEKARAQALLDVVNEINYFTQQHNS